MENIWFTSDTHAFHESILKWCPSTRQGATAEEMTDILVDNWNRTIKPYERVYILGDVSFGGKAKIHNFLSKLNGQLYLCSGNHDRMIEKSKEFHSYFTRIARQMSLKVGEHRFSLTHTPQAEWVDCHKGVYALHGHLHGNKTNVQYQQRFRFMDVGVDTRSDNLMIPYHIDEILDKLRDREIMSHH